MESNANEPGIERIEVDDLFEELSYDLAAPPSLDSELGRLLVLYGDNGTGKTTLLRAVYDLLSSHPRAGHRTRLSKLAFRRIAVTFRDGREVGATREGGAVEGAPFTFFVKSREGTVKSEVWEPRKRDPEDIVVVDATTGARTFRSRLTGNEDNNAAFDEILEHMAEVIPETIYYMGDDRSLESDALKGEDEDESEVYVPRSQRRRRQRPDPRTVALEKSFERAQDWYQRAALGASNLGGVSTNAIYVDVAERIASVGGLDTTSSVSADTLRAQLVALGERSGAFDELGLVPDARTPELIASLDRVLGTDREGALMSILVPFADALAARLDALEEVRIALSSFLAQAANFLQRKSVHFEPRHGFRVLTEDGDLLEPSKLSSGEKHLLLLLSSTLYTRDDGALYLIDEPELSLNMKWQRRLVESLIECTRGSGTAFLMASHSFELMATARERVVTLSPDV